MRKVLLEKLCERFAEGLPEGAEVTHHDLAAYCRDHHKNMGVSSVACSRQMKLCPRLKQLPDHGGIRRYIRVEECR